MRNYKLFYAFVKFPLHAGNLTPPNVLAYFFVNK